MRRREVADGSGRGGEEQGLEKRPWQGGQRLRLRPQLAAQVPELPSLKLWIPLLRGGAAAGGG